MQEVLVPDFAIVMRKLSNLITVCHLYGKVGIEGKEKCGLCKSNEVCLEAGNRRATFKTTLFTDVKTRRQLLKQ